MWYILIMNKNVIYIEPEDDITDVITKIENSKEKIVALVPPKKAGVFRSVVNIKLIAKVGTTAEKTIVLVTTDPSIIKLAAATRLPVTKDLQTAPSIPTMESEAEEAAKSEVVTVEDTSNTEPEEEKAEEKEEGSNDEDDTESGKPEAKEDTEDDSKAEKEDDKEEDAKPKQKKSKANGIADWVKSHKKLTIFGSIGIVALILLLVWAFVIAPAVEITVWIQTENKSFSENVSFTTNLSDEKADEGKFYLEEKKIESVQEVKFEATGQKNLGEKATGEVEVVATVSYRGGTKVINVGDLFTINGLSYAADNGVTMHYDGDDDSVCANVDEKLTYEEFKSQGCRIYAKVKVTATAPGTAYNISAADTGWNTTADVAVYSKSPMSGGTDNIITVVQQSDVLKAKEQLTAANESENKAKLLETVGDGLIAIDSSFEQTTADVTVTPAVDEEVKDGVTPVVKATTTAKIFVIDKTKVEQFITEKANLSDDQKIYEINNPFVENFVKSDGGYIGKLKTSYSVGPKVTDKEVLEMAKGKGIGDIQHDLKEISGVVSVETKTSYPWVMTVPNDTNKIKVDVKIRDK